jgi:glycosyltransferase involved in cell wall biosynthesis
MQMTTPMSATSELPTLEQGELSLSVVVATYNRAQLLPVLFKCLAEQTLAPDKFELILVDDGSREPARDIVEAQQTQFAVKLIEQANAGQASARDAGVRLASGDVVVILDDDMKLTPNLLENHLAWHQKGYHVVLGRIDSAQHLEQMPLFERFHAEQLEKFAQAFRTGEKPRGIHLCTGNVSFRRKHYVEIGGFDRTLKRSEDRELGIRLELNGARFVFGDDAITVHDSDHANLQVWLQRAYNYGVYDHRIYEKHPTVDVANPWRFFFMVHPISRPLMLVSTVFPSAGKRLSVLAWRASEFCDQRGLKQVAVHGATCVYGLEYFRGLRQQAGTLKRCLDGLRACAKRPATSSRTPAAGATQASHA